MLKCESGNFRPNVVYGPETGAQGEKGIAQLHPAGKLPTFYRRGYTNPFDPYQAISFFAETVAEEGYWAWACY